MSTTSPAERLKAAVIARRRELGEISQMEVWQAGGPSNTTLTTIENGRLQSLSRTTAKKLDKGLCWEAGSARRVWDGSGTPTPLLPGVTSSRESEILRQAIGRARLDAATKERLLAVLDQEARGA